MRGCPLADAATAAGGLLILLAGLGVGGALGCIPAGLLTGAGHSFVKLLSPCFVFASWAAILFGTVLVALVSVGAGSKAVLMAGFVLLGWGVAAGMALASPQDGTDAGRALVASCLGMAGAIAGLWLALNFVQERVALVLPSPAEHGPINMGDVLLLIRSTKTDPGELVFLRDRDGDSVVLAKLDSHGQPVFIGVDNVAPLLSTNWDTLGRVCFAFGGCGGGYGVIPQRASK